MLTDRLLGLENGTLLFLRTICPSMGFFLQHCGSFSFLNVLFPVAIVAYHGQSLLIADHDMRNGSPFTPIAFPAECSRLLLGCLCDFPSFQHMIVPAFISATS
jgi:hypothetical protein